MKPTTTNRLSQQRIAALLTTGTMLKARQFSPAQIAKARLLHLVDRRQGQAEAVEQSKAMVPTIQGWRPAA